MAMFLSQTNESAADLQGIARLVAAYKAIVPSNDPLFRKLVDISEERKVSVSENEMQRYRSHVNYAYEQVAALQLTGGVDYIRHESALRDKLTEVFNMALEDPSLLAAKAR